MSLTLTSLVMWGVRALIVLVFLAFGWRDVAMLFRRPARNMGMGLNRVWSVARTTMLEAWAGRVWILPILWVLAAIILVAVVRPFDESERMSLDIKMLFSAQEILLLVMMWVMACLSLPRERERKIIITNASKPLSRLEIVLGKIVGFSAMAGVMLGVLGLGTFVILSVEDMRIRRQAGHAYEIQKADYLKKSSAPVPGETVSPPSEALRRLSEEGSLFAYNYIAVPRDNLSVVGFLDVSQDEPVRWLKGGSMEKAVYTFPALPASMAALGGARGTNPFFSFEYAVQVVPGIPVPQAIQLRVSAQCITSRVPPPRPVERVVTLKADGTGAWEPANEDMTEIFTLINPGTGAIELPRGAVAVEVQCLTPGVFLRVDDGAPPDATGVVPDTVPVNLRFIPNRATPGSGFVPQPNPVVRGFERRDRQEVSGPTKNDAVGPDGRIYLESAVFRFPGPWLRDVPIVDGKFKVAINLETYKSDNIGDATRARISMRSMDRRGVKEVWHTEIEVAEKRLTTFEVPAEELGNTDPDKRGDLIMWVSCPTREHSVSVQPASLRLELPQTPFVINLIKSEIVLFLEATLLIAICVACSVRVGWPVAMLLSCVCILFGYFVEFIIGLQDYPGLTALNYRSAANPSLAYTVLDKMASGVWAVLGVISSFVPPFTIYKPQDFISNLQNMPTSVLWWQVVWTVVFVLPCIAVGHLLFRKQEIG